MDKLSQLCQACSGRVPHQSCCGRDLCSKCLIEHKNQRNCVPPNPFGQKIWDAAVQELDSSRNKKIKDMENDHLALNEVNSNLTERLNQAYEQITCLQQENIDLSNKVSQLEGVIQGMKAVTQRADNLLSPRSGSAKDEKKVLGGCEAGAIPAAPDVKAQPAPIKETKSSTLRKVKATAKGSKTIKIKA